MVTCQVMALSRRWFKSEQGRVLYTAVRYRYRCLIVMVPI